MLTTLITDALLNEVFRNTAYSQAATVYCGLITAITDKEAGTVTEATYTGYVRVATTFGAPGAGGGGRQITNSSAVTFPQNTGSSQDMMAFGIWDASTAGNLLGIGMIDADPPVVATADTADLFTSPAHGLSVDQRLRIERIPGTTLPTGVSENTTYWVISTGLTADAFKVSTTQGGGAVDITVAGSCLVLPFTPVTVATSSTPEFASSQLVLQLD